MRKKKGDFMFYTRKSYSVKKNTNNNNNDIS